MNGQLIGYRQRNGKLVEDSETSIARQRTQIGMVFQRFNLFPHKTALQNVIEAPIHVLRRPKQQAVTEATRCSSESVSPTSATSIRASSRAGSSSGSPSPERWR